MDNTVDFCCTTAFRVAAFSVEIVNTLASGCFRGFSEKKLPKRMWLCAGISPLLFGLWTWSKGQKTRQVFWSALEKKFFAWEMRVFVSDVISGGLLGHLGPLCLALGANH